MTVSQKEWKSTIRFSKERWEKVRSDSLDWWSGKLSRPLIQIRLEGNPPDRPEPEIPSHRFTAFYKDSVSAEAIIDRWDYDLSSVEYLGDAFPHVWPNFGAGVLAEFMGARSENRKSENTVWFHPSVHEEISGLKLEVNENSNSFRRICDILQAANSMWAGQVQIGLPDLGGALDVLSTFRPGENLLYDLYDHPQEVMEKIDQIHAGWWQAFDKLKSLSSLNPGHTCWAPIFSDKPYYMLQCDFAYMIGPDMFDEFVKPELEKSCNLLGNAFYHLDGKGQLAHLDSLLSIENLKGIQWIPGSGAPDITEWPEVYRKIHKAGKLIQIYGGEKYGYRTLDVIADQIGDASGIVLLAGAKAEDREDVEKFIESYGC